MTKTKFIIFALIIVFVLLISFIKKIELENEGHNYFGFQVCSFLGIEHIRKEWGMTRNIDFQFYSDDFYTDSVSTEINNNSLTNFYTVSFLGKMPVLYTHDVVCINSICDTINMNPYGCGTGMYIRRVEDKKLSENWSFNLNEEIELYIKDSIIPDSIILQKRLTSLELPWSLYKASDIYSNKLVIAKDDIKKILENDL